MLGGGVGECGGGPVSGGGRNSGAILVVMVVVMGACGNDRNEPLVNLH